MTDPRNEREAYAAVDEQSTQVKRHKDMVKRAASRVCMDTYRYCTDEQLCRDAGCQAAAQRRLEMSCHGDEPVQMAPRRGTDRAHGLPPAAPWADRHPTGTVMGVSVVGFILLAALVSGFLAPLAPVIGSALRWLVGVL